MPKVKISTIVSFSSESPIHLASNLLLLEPSKTTQWRNNDPTEDSAEVVLKLDSPCKITNINIGNCYSANIEILVGCSTEDENKFEVLLPVQEFMNESESRNGTKFNSVKTFLSSDFDPKVANMDKWDLVKVICHQPFIKNETFGLAFLAIYTNKTKIREEEEQKEEIKSETKPIPLQKSPRMIGKFMLREDSPEEEESKGSSLLERWKNEKKIMLTATSTPPKPKASSGTTDRNRMSLLYDSASSDEENKRVKHSAKKLKAVESKESRKRKSDDDSPVKKPKKQKNFSAFLKEDAESDKNSASSSSKEETKAKVTPKQEKIKLDKPSVSYNLESPIKSAPKTTRRFNELLNDVRIVISGIQNPERADIRQKALDMGAKYAGDWDSRCTHLICAFKNTPKFNQVKGKGKIITKDWIINGYKMRKRLPWRRYALDDADRVLDESEDEIFEAKPDDKKDDVLAMYDLNYDIPTTKNNSKTNDDDIYNRSTDDDNSRDAVRPKLFVGKSFYIHANVDDDKALTQSITEQNGKIVYNLKDADFILTKEKLNADDLGTKGTILDPKWVQESIEMDSLLPTRGFLMDLE